MATRSLYLNTTGRHQMFGQYLQIRLLLGSDIAGVVISYNNKIDWVSVMQNLNELCEAFGYKCFFNFLLRVGITSDFYGQRCMPGDLVNVDPDSYPIEEVIRDMTPSDQDRCMNIVKGLFKTYSIPFKKGDCRFIRRISQRVSERFPEIFEDDAELPVNTGVGLHPLFIDYKTRTG